MDQLDQIRQQLRQAYHQPEMECVEALIDSAQISSVQRQTAVNMSAKWVTQLRENKTSGLMEMFLADWMAFLVLLLLLQVIQA